MPFIVNPDVGTTRRGRMTERRALKIWEIARGLCVICGEPIDGARDGWYCEHIVALELGGSDDDSNIGPAHYRHKAEKDAKDHSLAAHAKRAKKRHLGIEIKDGPSLEGKQFPKSRKAAGRIAKPSLPPRELFR